jgi:hypothetical protein
MLIMSMALLWGCETPKQTPPVIPKPSSDSTTTPYIPLPPIVQPPTPEPQLYIANAKAILLSGDTVSVEFNTNVPATSKLKLIANEKEVDNQSISDKSNYHYYKFTELKQLTSYYAVIEANSATYDKTTITFTTPGIYLPEQTYPPSSFWYPQYYYPIPYVPPPTPPTTVQFWSGTVTVTVTTP